MSKDSDLYDEISREVMRVSDFLPNMSENRITLIRDLARGLDAKKIGIANCIMFSREADIISRYLSKDFEVFSVDCKCGNLKRDDIFSNGSRGSLCNPAGQAEYLNKKGCNLNISIGLCVGHDMIFNKKSNSWVTTLYTKDFTNNNNPDIAVESIAGR